MKKPRYRFDFESRLWIRIAPSSLWPLFLPETKLGLHYTEESMRMKRKRGRWI